MQARHPTRIYHTQTIQATPVVPDVDVPDSDMHDACWYISAASDAIFEGKGEGHELMGCCSLTGEGAHKQKLSAEWHCRLNGWPWLLAG